MKMKLFLCLVGVFVSANSFAGITIGTGYNLIANQYNYNGNDLNDLINHTTAPGIPDGCVLSKYINNSGGAYPWTLSVYSATSDTWQPNGTLDPGDGAFLLNPSATPFTLTFPGIAAAARSTPYSITPGSFYLLSDPSPQVSNYQLMIDAAPVDNSIVVQWIGSSQNYRATTFKQRTSTWTPNTPGFAVGEAAWVSVGGTPAAPQPPNYLQFVLNGNSATFTWNCFGNCPTGCALQASTDLVNWAIVSTSSPYTASPATPTYYRTVCY
jgi:hypothetical protein